MVDRERELAFLLGRATSGRPELIIMWGRRRTGKTTLLKALLERSRGRQWKLEPFGLADLGLFFPERTIAGLVEVHAVAGGVPYYLLQLDPKASLERNVKRRILSKGEVLFQEVPFLLREELREPRSYLPILAAIAAGSRKFGEISSRTGFDKANLGKCLATLQELHLVRREVPITEPDPARSRKGLYAVDDPFTGFWLRYVWPNLAELELERIDDVWTQRIRPDLTGYLASHAERALASLLFGEPLIDRMGFAPARVGRHWDSDGEIDIVALDAAGSRAALCEAKWSERAVGIDVALALRDRGEAVPALARCERST